MSYAEALAAVGLATRAGVYWAGRATLLSSPEDIEVYDRAFDAFDAFWLGGDAVDDGAAEDAPAAIERETGFDSGSDDGGVVPDAMSADAVQVRYSAREVLRWRCWLPTTGGWSASATPTTKRLPSA